MCRMAVVALMLVLSGCAVFPGEKVPKTPLVKYSGSAETRPSVAYNYTARSGLVGVTEVSAPVRDIIEGELVAVLKESENFSRISEVDGSADIRMNVRMTNSGDPAAMIPAFITGLSLFLIPSWATDNFDLVVDVEKKGGLKKQYVLADSTKLVQWLPMIFVFPANNFSVIPEVRKNMYRKVLADMRADGFLPQ